MKSHFSISVTINGRYFHAEGDPKQVNAKLDAFMKEVFSPLKNAIRTFTHTLDWRTTLGIKGTATLAKVDQRFRVLAKRHHPDRGGDRAKFEQIVAAREAAKLELAG